MSFFAELKRRNVLRVGAAYAAISWLLIQIAETTFPALGLGDAEVRIVILVAAVGFIPALIFAWAFELTPEGLRRDREIDRTAPATRRPTRRLDRFVMVALALALGYFAFDKFALAPQREAVRQRQQVEALEEATEAARKAGRTEAIVESYGEQSIVVLPFADLSAGGDQGYLADGIAEEVLNILAHYNDLRVISRSSAFALRDAGLSMPELSAKLDVGHVLEGSVRKAGDRIRVTAQLIEARSDTHLWSQTYDREIDDIFAIQNEIAAQVAQELTVRLIHAPARTTIDPATYELYLQGRGLLARHTPDDMPEAIRLFERVTAKDPDFAPGHVGTALAIYWQGSPGQERYERIEAAADRALALDPDNSDALAVLGRIRVIQSQTTEGRALLERSIQSNPNNPLGYRWLGQSYATSDPAQYVTMATKAWLLDPLDPTIHWHQVTSLGLLGRTDDALKVAREHLSYEPDDTLAYGLAGDTHFRAGHLGRAVKSYYRAYRARPVWVGTYAGIRDVFINGLGVLDMAEAWVEEVERNGHTDRLKVQLLYLQGRPEDALKLAADIPLGPKQSGQGLFLGFLTVRITHDLDRARQYYDEGFAGVGLDPRIFDPDLNWVHYIDYALILQRAGEVEAAADLAAQIQAHFDRQIADGIEVAYTGDHLQFLYAKLQGARNNAPGAVAALQQALREGHRCVPCLGFPHFDTVRDDPGFVAVLHDYETAVAADRQRLADEGMLLTPEQVLQLKDFSFDPFEQ
jgi:TolB-like protein/cytochrome c-type biogenesis protein CcmH/NrfG